MRPALLVVRAHQRALVQLLDAPVAVAFGAQQEGVDRRRPEPFAAVLAGGAELDHPDERGGAVVGDAHQRHKLRVVVELALVEPRRAVAAEELPHAGDAVVDALPGDIDRGVGREQVGDVVVHPAVEVVAVSRDAVLRGAELEQQGGVLRQRIRRARLRRRAVGQQAADLVGGIVIGRAHERRRVMPPAFLVVPENAGQGRIIAIRQPSAVLRYWITSVVPSQSAETPFSPRSARWRQRTVALRPSAASVTTGLMYSRRLSRPAGMPSTPLPWRSRSDCSRPARPTASPLGRTMRTSSVPSAAMPFQSPASAR
jgi:hypothetical protein